MDDLAVPAKDDAGAGLPVGFDARAAPVLHFEFGTGQSRLEFLRGGGDEGRVDELGFGIFSGRPHRFNVKIRAR